MSKGDDVEVDVDSGRKALEQEFQSLLHDAVFRNEPYKKMKWMLSTICRGQIELCFDPLLRLPTLCHCGFNYEKAAYKLLCYIRRFVGENPGAKLPITIRHVDEHRDEYIKKISTLYVLLSNAWLPEELKSAWFQGWHIEEMRDWLSAWTPDTSDNFPTVVLDEVRRLQDAGVVDSEIAAKLDVWVSQL